YKREVAMRHKAVGVTVIFGCLLFMPRSAAGEKPVVSSMPDMEAFRANIIDFYTGKGADLKDPATADALARMERTAKGHLESMVTDGQDPWPIAPPTAEEIRLRKSDTPSKTVKVPGTAKPAAGDKSNVKKVRGEEIGSWRDLGTKVQEASNSSSWSIAL